MEEDYKVIPRAYTAPRQATGLGVTLVVAAMTLIALVVSALFVAPVLGFPLWLVPPAMVAAMGGIIAVGLRLARRG